MDKEAFENVLKTQFVGLAHEGPNPFARDIELPGNLLEAVDWTMARSCEEVNAEREKIMCQMEKVAAELRASGEVE